VKFSRPYISNKMTGVPYFNAPWFDKVSAELTALGMEVFNPAQHDRERGLDPMACPSGHPDEARAAGGPPLREVLTADWTWIAGVADCVIVGPDWYDSKGAVSEVACAQALGLPVFEHSTFMALCRPGSPETADLLLSLKLPPIMEIALNPVTLG